jgi:hypothetical protein
MIEIFAPSPWQMTFGERAVLEGVLSQLGPRLSIEIGTAEGGSLERIALHSEIVHSFDLVEPSLPRERFENVTFHTGDSHALLPAKLAELAAAGENVDFVLVDGDHSAEGVAADLRDLLDSPAIGRTVILIHDTLNDIVRSGIQQVAFDDCEKVVHVELDVVAGHLSNGGPFHHELWGGIGVVVVDDRPDGRARVAPSQKGAFYDLFTLLAPVRDALVAGEHGGAAGEDELARVRAELAQLQRSASWRVTAPLRHAKRLLRSRAG